MPFYVLLQVLSGLEMRNKYDVLNSVGQQCYYAEEGKNFIQLCFLIN